MQSIEQALCRGGDLWKSVVCAGTAQPSPPSGGAAFYRNDFGLRSASPWWIPADWEIRPRGDASRLPIPVEIETPEVELPQAVEAAAYYVIAEALANVIKYARASVVDVRVTSNEDSAQVEVVDDGVGGADPAAGSAAPRVLDDRS